MLSDARERVTSLIKDGHSREEVVAARPMADYDATWGNGFLQPDHWIGVIYDAIASER